MLSSLAKFIFGGFAENEPETETPMQFETREDNDWLLVDMPDQPIDNEDLNSEGEEEDEILTAVPLLMTHESYICDKSSDEINMQIEQSRLVSSENEIISLGKQCTIVKENLAKFLILPDVLYLNQTLHYPADFALAVSECCKEFQQRVTNVSIHNTEQSFFHAKFPKAYKKRVVAIRVSPTPVVADKRINHPAAYSKNFVNHRPAALPPKTALIEQIKELKPMQNAIEYNAKKYLTRSQMNRQNRNYIYETSVKTNRRRNLQRNHSGANNNRKCY